jgi:hypothetical protein
MTSFKKSKHKCESNAKAHGPLPFICIGLFHIRQIRVPNHPWPSILKCMKAWEIDLESKRLWFVLTCDKPWHD